MKRVKGELRATVAQRAHDPAPVRVAAMHRGLDQTRRRDRTGSRPGIFIGGRIQHLARDQFRRTLAVPRDRPRKLPRHQDEARLKLLGL